MLETVTAETYIRAETDRSFHNIVQLNGGAINTSYYFRGPTPLDKQTVVRMNKDTLYSGAIVDTSGGATVTLPQVPDGRYMSILLVDNDHFSPEVFYAPGVHELPKDTKYLGVFVRTQLFNPDDPAEIALVNTLQDQVIVNAKSADPLPAPKWQPASLTALTERYEKDSLQYSSWKGMMGPRQGRRDNPPYCRGGGLGPLSRMGRDLPELQRRGRLEGLPEGDLCRARKQVLLVDHSVWRGRLHEEREQHAQRRQRQAQRRRHVHRLFRTQGGLRRRAEPA